MFTQVIKESRQWGPWSSYTQQACAA